MILCWMVDYVVYRIGQYYKYVGYWISQYDDNKYIYTYVCIYIYICMYTYTYIYNNYNAETTGEQLRYNADHWHDPPKQKISTSVKTGKLLRN